MGLFTSPHLFDFRERIRVNGKMISEQEVVGFCEMIRNTELDFKPSFFEITFVMAIRHFINQNCDYVVLETGMGGRLDAVTGRIKESGDYIKSLGAETLVPRQELAEAIKRPLESERWAGCIDNVGGEMLARILGQLKYGCSAAAIGNAGGHQMPASVIPFLLRGVNLLGIDSVNQPYDSRVQAWSRLVDDFPLDKLDSIATEITLDNLETAGKDILNGKIQGRYVVCL